MFWPEAHQYRHLVPLNEPRLICNHKLFDVAAHAPIDPMLLCGVLNSTVCALFKHLYGRLAGTEGNLQTAVIDVKMMPVPDVRKATVAVASEITRALLAMMRRKTRNLTDEFSDSARLSLDNAVLQLLGAADALERDVIRKRLYADMTAMHEAIRDKELRAIENKKQTKRGGGPSAETLAAEIWGCRLT